MTEEKLVKINPNIADERTLQQLPGIGSSLAKKIVESRPYAKLDDLAKVRGIGKSVLEHIEPMLMFEVIEDRPQADEEEVPHKMEVPVERMPVVDVEPKLLSPDGQRAEDLSLSQSLVDTTQEEEAIVGEDVEKKAKEKPRPEAVKKPQLVRAYTRTETIWLLAAVGVLSLILSVLLTMIVLGGINGTLNFNQLQGLKQLENDVVVLEEDLANLSSSLDAFDQRLTPLEGLTGRMTLVEDLTESLQVEVEDALTTVETMQSDLEGLSNETARLSGRVDRFDIFLDGLHRLLTEIFAEPSSDTLPES